MQFVFCDLGALSSEALPEDDVDRLFQKLQRHEPPLDIVKQLLARIRQLPPEQQYPSPAPVPPVSPVCTDQKGAGASH
jgi:hypothetical protein